MIIKWSVDRSKIENLCPHHLSRLAIYIQDWQFYCVLRSWAVCLQTGDEYLKCRIQIIHKVMLPQLKKACMMQIIIRLRSSLKLQGFPIWMLLNGTSIYLCPYVLKMFFSYTFLKVALRKQRMYISRVNRKVFSHATKGTQYENLNMVIFQSTALVVCQEPKVSTNLLKILQGSRTIHVPRSFSN